MIAVLVGGKRVGLGASDELMKGDSRLNDLLKRAGLWRVFFLGDSSPREVCIGSSEEKNEV
jgi:hypothetical protein